MQLASIRQRINASLTPTEQKIIAYLDLVGTPEWRERLGPIEQGEAGAAALADVPVAAHDEELPLIRIYWLTVFHSPPHLQALLVANSLRATLQFARRGIGVTVLPSHTTSDAVERGELVRLLTPTAPVRSRLYLAWRAGSLRRVALARAHERIARAARER